MSEVGTGWHLAQINIGKMLAPKGECHITREGLVTAAEGLALAVVASDSADFAARLESARSLLAAQKRINHIPVGERPVDIAINHDAEAISLHMRNHPQAEHYQKDIREVCPKVATRGRQGTCHDKESRPTRPPAVIHAVVRVRVLRQCTIDNAYGGPVQAGLRGRRPRYLHRPHGARRP